MSSQPPALGRIMRTFAIVDVYHVAYGPLARKYEEKLAIKRSQAD